MCKKQFRFVEEQVHQVKKEITGSETEMQK